MSLTKESIEKKVEEMEKREKNKQKEHEKKQHSKSEPEQIIPRVNPDVLNTALASVALEKMGHPSHTRASASLDPQTIALAKKMLSCMDCTLITMEEWDCNKTEKGKKLTHPFYKKGEEPQCSESKFVNCPSWRLYFSHRVSRLFVGSEAERKRIKKKSMQVGREDKNER